MPAKTKVPTMIKMLLLSIACCFGCSYMFAQDKQVFQPIKDDSIALVKMQRDIKEKFISDSLKTKGEYKKYINRLYRERYDEEREQFARKQVICNDREDKYLQQIVQEIMQHNPPLQSLKTRIVFTRAYWPNAASIGDGTIFFNIGLFSRLQNEAQVAFVLCHELAHYYLDHSTQSIEMYVNTVYNDDFQKELKKIKRSSYEQNKQLNMLEKSITFKSRRHGRSHESEADATALTFLKNTRFDVRESLSCIGSLDSIDNEHYVPEIELPKRFDFAAYHFKPGWIRKDAGFFGNAATEITRQKEADSLKTHPDCKQRMIQLQPEIEKTAQAGGQLFLISETTFHALQETFRYEIIAYLYRQNSISRTLYYSLELLQTHPQDVYLVTMIGNCLNALYKNQKEHSLGKISELPSPQADKNYNGLLNFIQALRLDDIAGLSYNFLSAYQPVFASDPGFAAAYSKAKQNFAF